MYQSMPARIKELIGEYIWCGVAHSTNEQLRKESTSGGLVSSLLLTMLRKKYINGALVVRNDGLEHKGIVARTESEIIAAAGSKYLQIPLNVFLSELINEDGKFAVVGLPCHLKGLRKLESLNPKLKDKIILKIGLFCSHAVSYNGVVFLLNAFGVKREEVAELRYRKKMHGTTGLYVKTLSGSEIFIPSSKYWGMFFNFFFIPEGCMYCEDLTAECSDISVGDAWGFEEAKQSGLSLFIVRSKMGEEALRLAISEGLIKVRSINPENVIKSQKYLLVKKRSLMKGNRKIVGYAYYIAQVIGNHLSKSEKYHSFLRAGLVTLRL